MSATPDAWPVFLTAAAEADFELVVRWSARQFGVNQARIYAETLTLAVEALVEGPSVIGAKARSDIGKGLMSLHVARLGRKGRHFVIFRFVAGPASKSWKFCACFTMQWIWRGTRHRPVLPQPSSKALPRG